MSKDMIQYHKMRHSRESSKLGEEWRLQMVRAGQREFFPSAVDSGMEQLGGATGRGLFAHWSRVV